MRKIISAIGLLAFLTLSAQQNVHLKSPGQSPVIGDDGKVTFNLHAPGAKRVQLAGHLPGQPIEMTQQEGNWTASIEGLEPDIYDYWFEIDSVRTMDPSNPYVVRDVAYLSNIFVVTDNGYSPYLTNNVPHGKVEKVWYRSDKLGGDRRMSIYTPPGYDGKTGKYPVLYLLHGMGGDEEAWQDLGRTVQMLDNLIATGQAEPMIVVMPNGNALLQAAPGFSTMGLYTPEGNQSVDPDRSFEAAFPEIVAFVEDNYLVDPSKSKNAIAGLSMGGGHAWKISMMMPDKFDYVGMFSPAIWWDGRGVPVDMNHPEVVPMLERQFQSAPQFYWIAIGNEDFLYDLNAHYRNLLDSHGFPYEYYESEGGHTWVNWRHYLLKFLPRLFKTD